MKLIGLAGYARSGKDTVGTQLIAQGYTQYSFAGPIRCAASCMFGIPVRLFEGTNPDRDKVDEFWGFSLREMLQKIGTEGGRELFRQDIWIRRAEAEWAKMKRQSERWGEDAPPPFRPPGMVITDVRFPNEAEWILSEGGVVLNIDRAGVGPQSGHASEKALPQELISVTLYNHGTIEDLHQNAELVLKDLLKSDRLE